jgi:hypothetical protein
VRLKNVLWWLITQTKNLKKFVAARCDQILGKTKEEDWYYINTALNPADVASRGCNVEELEKIHVDARTTIPERRQREQWPLEQMKYKEQRAGVDEDAKKELKVPVEDLNPEILNSQSDIENIKNDIFTRFASWTRVVNVVENVYCCSYKVCQRLSKHSNSKILTSKIWISQDPDRN